MPQTSLPAPPKPQTRPLLMAAAILLTLGVFAADFTAAPGIDIHVLYVLPVLLVSFAGSAQLAIAGTWVTSLLTVAGLLRLPLADLPAFALPDRLIALAIIWTTATIVLRLRATSQRLEASTRDLADMKYALDQSAIVATTNPRGIITFVNDKFCEISRYSREELLGRDHRILNSGHHPKEFIRDLWQTISHGRIWRGEIRNRAKDGTLYWVDTTIVPFLDATGTPYQYMAIRSEITTRKQQEEQLREQAALARLGEMAAVVAHEVKNPIAGIRGALQVIVSRMSADQRDRSVIGDIIARLDALNGIVQDMLIFARPRQLKREPVDGVRLIENTIAFLKRDPALAGLNVTVEGQPGAISADGEQLHLVVQNILMNAAQAMGGHGLIEIALAGEGELCRVSIRDHGPGMTPEVREKAFDAFFTTRNRGTGLGLAIAKRIVDAHGGHIEIGPAQGGGTVVSISLPFAR